MKKFKFKIRGNSFETVVKDIEEDIMTIEVNGTSYSVEIEKQKAVTKTPRLVRAKVQNAPGEGLISKTTSVGSTVKAPLPGTIFKIMVKVGDAVKAGDVVLIMEAMKMENNIMAEKAGVVSAINVKEGETVLQDKVLVELK